jgi:hypothetical protein
MWTTHDRGRAYHTPFRRITYRRTMHGTLPFSEQQALASLRGGTAAGRKSIAVLAREWGWSRDTVRRRLESWRHNGDLTAEQVRPQRRTAMPAAIAAPASLSPPSPPAAWDSASRPEPDLAPDLEAEIAAVIAVAPRSPPETLAAAPVIVSPAPPAPSRLSACGRLLATIIVASVGVALAVIGMIETTAYAMRVGGWLFAALAICADALVLFMPAAAAGLWRRRSPATIVAAALWLGGGAVTLANLSGYIGSSDDAFRAVRETQATQRSLALEQLARLRTERAAISELRPVGALNVAINNVRKSKRPALREALAVAQRRDALEARLSAVSASLPTVPQIALVDPSAGVLSEISGATVSETLLRRVRLALLLLLPLCGGFVLSVALSLFPEALRRSRPAPTLAP